MKKYRVYKYQYNHMKRPKWDAKPHSWPIDCLPPTVIGLIHNIKATNKREAIRFAKQLTPQ
jgi:hypothetical protein